MRQKGKKLIVMVPCYNEEKTLPLVINSIPKKIPGISKIETLVIDDGSTDKTSQVAKKLRVNYLVRHITNKGLAASFSEGIDFCLEKGADIIVNTDGDNQYPQAEIPRLIRPILEGKTEIVIADRQTNKIESFSWSKKILQKFGSWVVRNVSGIDVPDAVSGFRARTREAALQTNIFTDFSYVIETIIQAGKKKIPVVSVPIQVNPKTRPSRLFKTNWGHIKSSAATIIRVATLYEPLKTFSYIGGLIFLAGAAFLLRFVYYYIIGVGTHLQSLIVSAILLLIGFQIIVLGLLADMIANNRKLMEKTLIECKKERLKRK